MPFLRSMSLLLVGAALMMQGCAVALIGAGAGAGAGTYAYVRGEHQVTYPYSFNKTYSATLAALKDLQIPVVDAFKDLTDGTIMAKKGDGSDVKILLKTEGDKVTMVKVRVGIFGDEAASKRIVEKISTRLGE